MLRTSLALSLVTGKPFQMVNIRAGRSKPGLLRQHLTAVKAAAAVGDAELEGAELHSKELTFRPRSLKSGDYHFAVGTAGSATLVLQTVLRKRSADHTFRMREEPFSVAFQEV